MRENLQYSNDPRQILLSVITMACWLLINEEMAEANLIAHMTERCMMIQKNVHLSMNATRSKDRRVLGWGSQSELEFQELYKM